MTLSAWLLFSPSPLLPFSPSPLLPLSSSSPLPPCISIQNPATLDFPPPFPPIAVVDLAPPSPPFFFIVPCSLLYTFLKKTSFVFGIESNDVGRLGSALREFLFVEGRCLESESEGCGGVLAGAGGVLCCCCCCYCFAEDGLGWEAVSACLLLRASK